MFSGNFRRRFFGISKGFNNQEIGDVSIPSALLYETEFVSLNSFTAWIAANPAPLFDFKDQSTALMKDRMVYMPGAYPFGMHSKTA